MSQTSCIRRLPKTKFVIRREELLAIADNNDCAAQLLHLFEFWTNAKIDEQHRIQQYNQVAAKAGSPLLKYEGLWLYESIKQIQAGLLDGYSEKTIRNSLKFLESKGFIKTKPSNIPWDRTKYYVLQIEAVNAALDKWDKFRQQTEDTETPDLPEAKTLESIEPVILPQETVESAETLEKTEPVILPQETVKVPLEAVKLPLEEEVLPSLLYKEIDLISRSKEHTPLNPLKGQAALANATPAPHPSMCVASQVEEEEVKVNQHSGLVDKQIEAPAQNKDSIGGENAATREPNKRRNTQSESQSKWRCPGSAEEKLEFLRWKGKLLVAAGKTSKAEAESHALAWANKHPEEASLAYQGWKRERLAQPTPAPKTPASVLATPNIESMPRSRHEELIKAYQQEGKEAFLARESWHGEWLKFAKTYFSQQFIKVNDAS